MSRALKYCLNPAAIAVGAKFSIPNWGDSGYDLYACEPVTLFSNEQKLVPTGLRLEIPPGYVGLVKDRSSLALKSLYVHAGVIDPSYRGEVQVLMENRGEVNYHIEPGQRVAQILFLSCKSVLVPKLVEKDELSVTARGDGAFGSTGV